MRKRIIYIISVLLLFFQTITGYAQELLPTLYDTLPFNNEISLHGNIFEHSTSLNNEFARKFMFGGEISKDLSKKTYEKQKDYNRFGVGEYVSLEYRSGKSIFKKNENWSWMIGAADNFYIWGDYSSDLFGLAFLGNEPFLGKKLDLSNTYGRYERFLTVGGGFHNLKTKSYITLHAVLPISFFDIDVEKGDLSFNQQGDEIKWNIDAEVNQSNPYPFFKGMGAAVNFGFNFNFGKPDAKFNGVLNITGRNIGFYYLNDAQKTTIRTKDVFSGFALDDLFKENVLENLKDTFQIETVQKGQTKLLPGFIQIGKVATVHSSKKLQSIFGIRMYLNRSYKPMLYAGIHYQPFEQFSLGAQGTFGGYGNFRVGLYASYHLENLLISIGTEDILGAVLRSQLGHSILLKVTWRF
ncbi:MAG: hypothetical protein H3C31_09255 [Brumimicrobium sp.]|nr:hypothetical protein [Brumimicrobium sp.]MCO5269981.1 hypothetical protein [Brumimicrobium sp.]